MRLSTLRRGLVAMVGLAALAMPARALTITPTFDSTVTSAGNAADIQAAINSAASAISALYSDSGNVNIVFRLGSTGLGSSQSAIYTMPYAGYTAALAADAAANPANTTLATALANLSTGNGAAGTLPIKAGEVQLRVALGVAGATPCFNASGAFVSGCNSTHDGVITLSNTASIDYVRPVASGFYDAIAVLEHEINEILGGGGPGTVLNGFAATCSALTPTAYGSLDLYRYSAPGTPSFTTCPSASSYLSVDGGVTSIVGFNQSLSGDMADFVSGYVQSAFGTTGAEFNVTTATPEYPMMLALGYDPVAAPEPASVALLGGCLAGLGFVRRRRG